MGLHRDERGPELLVFYSVADLDAAAKRIVELGGEVDEAGGEDDSGRWLYSCRDDQGVVFGLHEPPVGARPYLRSFESRRSLSTRPSVCSSGQ